MVTNDTTALRQGLPGRRSEWIEVVLIGHGREACEDVAHIGERIDATALAGNDDRVDNRGALAGVGMALL